MTSAARKRVAQALEILVAIGVPAGQRNERSALTLLALADLRPRAPWKSSAVPLRRITEMMDWMSEHYQVSYAPNTRETIRRQTVHQFVQQGLLYENPDRPDRPINSPKWCYQLSEEVLLVLRSYGTPGFAEEVERFGQTPAAHALRPRHRNLPKESVFLPDGRKIELSVGGQNSLIGAIVEEFIPRFVRRPSVLLLGDAADKDLVTDSAALLELGVRLSGRGKAPDVMVHDQERDWLVIVEAVTSHGPVDQKRKNELSDLFSGARPGLVFVTAFPDRKTFARFQASVAWETEVWIADEPDHLIHFNGERFLGPYSQ